ncbi:beta strand repeat-containing protein, partial [Singulisphaera rosea]
ASGVDSYKFTLASPTRLWFDSQLGASVTLTLVGPQGAVVTNRYFYYDDQDLGMLPAGTYSLKVSGSAGVAYAFNVLDFAAATAVTQGTAVSDSLNPANSAKIYRFSGTVGSTVFIDNTSLSSSDPNNPVGSWSLFDPFGAQVFDNALNVDSGRITLGATGTYTLVVRGYLNASGSVNYGFNVRPVNDTTSTLTIGTPVTGNVASPAQNNNYTFTLAAPTRLWFDSRTNDGSLSWYLSGPQGTVLGGGAFSYDDQSLGLLPAGSYTLTVPGGGDYTGGYTFNLLNLATATAITPGTSVSGTLNPANSTNLYQFSGTAGSTIFLQNTAFSTTDPSGFGGVWSLLDPFGYQVFNSSIGNDSGRITLGATGTYTLVLQGAVKATGTESYTFNVIPVTDDLLQLWGTTGDDNITVQYLDATTRDVYLNGYLQGTLTGTAPLTINSRSGNDTVTIIGTSAADTFTVTPNSVSLGGAAIVFANNPNRIVDGSGGDDVFNYSGVNSKLQLLGGAGLDTFKAADGASVLRIDGGANGGILDESSSSVGVVLDVAGGKVTGVSQVANITSVVGSPRNDAPLGIPKTVATPKNVTYVFTVADFGFIDPGDTPANALLSVKVVSLPGAGSLTNNGVAVAAGSTVLASDIAGGKLKFIPASNATGAPYASFTFQVRDNGGTANGGIDTDPTARTLTITVS